MKVKLKLSKMQYILYIAAIFSILVINYNNTYADLSYGSQASLSFDISPSIQVSVSGDLIIDELAPGSYSDSNIITASVATNVPYGYHMSVTVGSSDSNATNHNTKLTNTNDNNYYFTNLASNINTLSSFNDNTWGYSYSTDSGTTWISGSKGSTSVGYNGLPLDNNDSGATGVTLIDTNAGASNQSVKFKIGAKASNVQAAGEYTNTVNFYAVSYVEPTYIMQDIASWKDTLVTDQQYQAIDNRDNKVYWVAKLQDGKVWMTQNLDLNLSTSTTLSSDDTDLRTSGSGGYIDGYTTSGGKIYWTPERNTIDAITTADTSIYRFPEWENDADNPYSLDAGNWYWDGATDYASSNCSVLSTTDPNYIGCDFISKRREDKSGTAVTNNWMTYFHKLPLSRPTALMVMQAIIIIGLVPLLVIMLVPILSLPTPKLQ